MLLLAAQCLLELFPYKKQHPSVLHLSHFGQVCQTFCKVVDHLLLLSLLISESNLSSVLWHCWLDGRKSIWPVKSMELWDPGVIYVWSGWCCCNHYHLMFHQDSKWCLVFPLTWKGSKVGNQIGQGIREFCLWYGKYWAAMFWQLR